MKIDAGADARFTKEGVLQTCEESGTVWLWAFPELLAWPRPITWLFSPVTGSNSNRPVGPWSGARGWRASRRGSGQARARWASGCWAAQAQGVISARSVTSSRRERTSLMYASGSSSMARQESISE